MPSIRPTLLKLLSSMLLLLSAFHANSSEENISAIEKQSTSNNTKIIKPLTASGEPLIKSKVSFGLTTLLSDGGTVAGSRVSWDYKPDTNDGFVMNLELESLSKSGHLKSLGVDDSLKNLRFSSGYQFDLSDNFSVTPALGMTINTNMNDISSETFHKGDAQARASVKLAYRISNSFSVSLESEFGFDSSVFNDTSSYGIGFKFTPHYIMPKLVLPKKTPAISLPTPDVAPIVDVVPTPDVTPAADLAPAASTEITESTSTNYDELPFTIQIAVFTNISEANAYLKNTLITPEDVSIRQTNGIVKLYYKGFESVASANEALSDLQSKGIAGFVNNRLTKASDVQDIIVGPFYTVQLGSFLNINSATPIISQIEELEKTTFTEKYENFLRLHTGKFNTKAKAKSEMTALKGFNIDGFVIKKNKAQ